MVKRVKSLRGIMVYLLISIFAVTLILNMPSASKGQQVSNMQLLVSPERVEVSVNETFIITVNLTNVDDLYSWQVVLNFNGSVLNCTDVWIPEDNVFAGHIIQTGDWLVDVDYITGLNFLMFAASLQGIDSVDVDNGILFKANFTAIGSGSTQLTFATKDNPAKRSQFYSFYSYIMNFNLEKLFSFSCNFGVVMVGAGGKLPPVAAFTVSIPELDLSNYIVLKGYAPVGKNIPYIYAYKGIPVTFNASSSYDPDGNVTLYIWDFGDGNITETTSPVVVHVYNKIGRRTVELKVVDNDNIESQPCHYVVVVGLILERFDWSPYLYGLGTVIVAGVVIQSVRAFLRRRRARLEGRG